MNFFSTRARDISFLLGQALLATLAIADNATTVNQSATAVNQSAATVNQSAVAASKSAPAIATTVPTSPLNLILGILFLLALIAAAWWLLRRANGLQWPAQRAAMKVVASLPLGTRERVVLVEIAGQQWLLGVATGQVTLLHRFEEPIITSVGGGDDFAQRMRQILQNSIGRS